MRTLPVLLTAITGITVAGGASANLIINGDFESGNTGFSSDYIFGSLQGATRYDIVSDPANEHSQAASYGDNTTGSGLMLAVNGCCEPAVSPIPDVWTQTVSVDAFTDYLFTMFVSSWFPENPAFLGVYAPELGILGTVAAPSMAGVWQQYQVGFNSGANSWLTLNITDLFVLTGGAGNDFALDDISLVAVSVPEPGTLSLLGAGLLGLGFMRNRRRAQT